MLSSRYIGRIIWPRMCASSYPYRLLYPLEVGDSFLSEDVGKKKEEEEEEEEMMMEKCMYGAVAWPF